jgi:hypothetical protein
MACHGLATLGPRRGRNDKMGLRAGARFGLAVFAACVCNSAVVLAEELVRFGNVPVRVSQIQQRLAQERGETLRAAADTIEGHLSKPEGDGPFAAVVYLHGCAGLSENVRMNIAQLMTGWGYVSLAVDSFTSRGIKDQCNDPAAYRLGCPVFPLSILNASPSLDHLRVHLLRSDWRLPMRTSSTALAI